MAASVGKLAILLSADASGLDSGLSGAVGKLNSFKGKASGALGAGLVAGGAAAIGKSLDLFQAGVSALIDRITDLVGLLKQLISYSIRIGQEFERQFSRAAAIFELGGGAVRSEIDALREEARRLGRETEFTGAQAAEAMGALAMGGFSAKQAIESTTAVLDLARISGMSLSDAADLVAISVAGFGLEAKEATRVVDVLAKTAISTTTNVQDLGDAFKYALPAAVATGRSVEEVSAALGIMAKSGIRGSMAGTALRGIMMKMARPTVEAKAALADIGVEFFDAQGKAKKFTQILVEVGAAIEHMNDQQQLEFFGVQFEKRAATGFIALKNKGAQAVGEFEEMLLRDAGGTGRVLGEKIIDNVWGAKKILESAIEGLAEGVFSKFARPLKEFLLEAANQINRVAPVIHEAAEALTRLGAAGLTRLWEELGGPEGGIGALFGDESLKQAQGFFRHLEDNALTFFAWLKDTWKEVAGIMAAELVRAFALASQEVVKLHIASLKKAAFSSPVGAVGLAALPFTTRGGAELDLSALDREKLNRRWQAVIDKLGPFKLNLEPQFLANKPLLTVVMGQDGLKGAPMAQGAGKEMGKALAVSLAAGLEKGSVEAVSAVNRWRVQSGRLRKEEEQLLLQKRQAAAAEDAARGIRGLNQKLNFKVV